MEEVKKSLRYIATMAAVIALYSSIYGCFRAGEEFNRKYERFKLQECLHETGQLAVCDQRYPTSH